MCRTMSYNKILTWDNKYLKTDHCVSTQHAFGLQCSKIHLCIDTDIFIIMVNDEIIRHVGNSIDITTIQPEFILTLDGEPYNNYYGMMCNNVQIYLGPTMDIECILRNFLSKHNLIIVAKDDIHSMCITVGIGYEHWLSMYNNYIAYKDNLSLPYDVNFINVFEVFLYRHSIRGNW